MYGDPAALRRLADQISSAATQVRSDGRAAVARAQSTQWESSAAQQHRNHMDQTAGDLDAVASRLDEAATALREHAAKVEEVIAEIQRAETAVRDWFSAAATNVENAAHTVIDEISSATGTLMHTWSATDLPVPGSKDWLALGQALGVSK